MRNGSRPAPSNTPEALLSFELVQSQIVVVARQTRTVPSLDALQTRPGWRASNVAQAFVFVRFLTVYRVQRPWVMHHVQNKMALAYPASKWDGHALHRGVHYDTLTGSWNAVAADHEQPAQLQQARQARPRSVPCAGVQAQGAKSGHQLLRRIPSVNSMATKRA